MGLEDHPPSAVRLTVRSPSARRPDGARQHVLDGLLPRSKRMRPPEAARKGMRSRRALGSPAGCSPGGGSGCGHARGTRLFEACGSLDRGGSRSRPFGGLGQAPGLAGGDGQSACPKAQGTLRPSGLGAPGVAGMLSGPGRGALLLPCGLLDQLPHPGEPCPSRARRVVPERPPERPGASPVDAPRPLRGRGPLTALEEVTPHREAPGGRAVRSGGVVFASSCRSVGTRARARVHGVPGKGLEPQELPPADFESAASTNSASRLGEKPRTSGLPRQPPRRGGAEGGRPFNARSRARGRRTRSGRRAPPRPPPGAGGSAG